jgi:hypothetical protein
MEHLRFIKGLGLLLIALGVIISVSTALYINELNPENSYNFGLLGGVAIGMSLSGAILRLYSASNK